MNKVYRHVWSRAAGGWIAVSERTRRPGPGGAAVVDGRAVADSRAFTLRQGFALLIAVAYAYSCAAWALP